MKKNFQDFSFKNLWSKISYFFKTISFARNLLLFYLIITIIGAVLLVLPISQTGYIAWNPFAPEGDQLTPGDVSFVDSLFIAASAFSDTGLSTHTISITYTLFGQAIVAILIFIGGIGFFALKVYIINIIFGYTLGYRGRAVLAAERGSIKVGISQELIKVVVTILLIIMSIFTIILSAYFFYTDVSDSYANLGPNGESVSMDTLIYENPYHNFGTALRYGIFHTISAINNAGFDIIGNNSLQPYYFDYAVQIIFICLFVIGGIGYPVIYDVFMYLKTRKTQKYFTFSLFTKLSVITYLLISVFGLGITFAIEANNSNFFWNDAKNEYGSTGDKVMALFFNTMSTRNAGFSTIAIHDLSRATLLVYIVLMFIGSAPSSTAGGIRTTTIAIIFLSLWARIRGRTSTYVFRRRIPTQTVNRAFIVFFISISLVLLATLISVSSYDVNGGNVPTLQGVLNSNGVVTSADDFYDFTEMLFEVGSAFGTTGLSAGVTPLLSTASKVSLILLMFIGQLGISSTILIWGKRQNSDNHFKWLNQDVIIG